VQLALVERRHIRRQSDVAVAAEADAGLAGGKIERDQARIVRAQKDPVGAGHLRSGCCIVPNRNTAADEVVRGV
jgi:hypothetical protein